MSNNREYKSDVFSMLMEVPEYALEIYNVLNGSHYTDPTQIYILTLTDATDCYIATQFSQSYKHLHSRIFASKSASCRCLAGQASR